MKQPKKTYDVKFARRMTNRIEYCIRQFADRFDETGPTDDQVWFVQRMIKFAIEYGRRQEALDHYAFQSIRDFGEKKMKVKIDDGGFMPKRAHAADAGLDLCTPELIVVPAHGSCVVDTRVHIAIPAGWFGKIESKSGLMCRNGVVSAGGVIDSGYTGSIIVKLENHTTASYKFERGDKIAQIIFIPCLLDDLQQVPDLDATDRGDNGFGSTGK